MSTEFDGLTLGDILEITGADSAHSYDIDVQAQAVRAIGQTLAFGLVGFTMARGRIDNGMSLPEGATPDGTDIKSKLKSISSYFAGSAAEATFRQMSILTKHGGAGLNSLSPQSDVFTGVASEARTVHSQMQLLRDERNGYLRIAAQDPKDPQLAEFGKFSTVEQATAAINHEYDTRAQQRMQQSADYYLESVNTIEVIKPYDGPRTPRPEEAPTGGDGDRGPGNYSSPGPPLTRNQPGTGSVPPPVGDLPITTRPPQEEPELQVGAPPPHSGVTPIPGTPGQPPPGVPGTLVPDGYFMPHRPVVSPVIGARPGGPTPFGNNRANLPTQSGKGLIRPVIGDRPGKTTNAMGQPNRGNGRSTVVPNRNGLNRSGGVPPRTGPAPRGGGLPIRPGTGGRPATGGRPVSGGNGKAPFDGSARRTATPAPKTFGREGAGVRAQPRPPQSTTGRVIGRRGDLSPKKPATPSAKPTARSWTRTPKVHHGDTALNRPVIKSGSATPTIRVKTKPKRKEEEPYRPSDENPWYDLAPTLSPVIRGVRDDTEDDYHDPGDFVTRSNLGKRRLTGD